MRKLNAFLSLATIAVCAEIANAAVSTVAGLYSSGAGTYTISGTVTAILDTFPVASPTKNTFVISDGTGSVIAYSIAESTYTASPGDVITITATNSPYQSAPELINTNFTLNSVTGGVATPPTLVSAASLTSSGGLAPLSEAYVEIDDVTLPAGTTALAAKAGYTLTDATARTATLYTYTSYSNVANAVTAANANPSLLAGAVNIIGYAAPFTPAGGSPQLEIYPLSITPFVSTPEPASMAVLGATALLLARRRRD